MGVFERRLMPLAEVVGKNRYLLTLRDTFAAIMPLLIVGSFFTLVGNFPITAWTDFLSTATIGGETLAALISVPGTCTVSMMALFVAFLMGYNFAEHERLDDRLSAGIVSLLAWLLLLPLYTDFTPEGASSAIRVASVPLGWIGSKGVFVAIVSGFLSVKLYGALVRKDLMIKMPEGVPPTVSRAFSSLIPMTATVVCAWLVRVLFTLTPWGDFFTFLYSFLQIPLQNLGGTVVAQAFVYVVAHVLWFFGIHGTSITDSVYQPILLALSAQNQEAITAGLAAPNIINYQFQSLFATLGGGGSTLSLLVAMLFFCKSDRIRKLAKLSIGPGVFNINEPVIFGLPIVLNPVLLVPFVLVPLFNIVTTYGVMAAGLVPVANGVLIPWTTPAIISGFLVSGWQGAVWQAILLVCGVLIYLPFIKTLDGKYLAEQERAEREEPSATSAIDDIDLADLDFDF
ncbi:MAG: PTS sugar transporter subunit IIC [Coriobacteriaceae bacterium]|nr:PTS sugar transporter subunit IIC [Coriobacteriaceae bacterium]